MTTSASSYFNIEAESAAIAAFMKRGVAKTYLAQVAPGDFYDADHGDIIKAMQSLAVEKKNIDIPSMAQTFTHLFGDDSKMEKLFEIIGSNKFDVEFSIRQNIEIIKRCAARRKLCKTLVWAKKNLDEDGERMDAVMERVRSDINEVQNSKSVGVMTMQNVVLSAFDELERRAKGNDRGMPSGIGTLDAITAGFHRGELTIVGARPAVGKSAFAGQVAIETAKAGHRVCICSREMTAEQYGIRMITRGAEIPNIKLRKGELNDDQWDQVCESMTQFGDVKINFLFKVKTVEELRIEVQQMVDGEGLDMLVVDYVQLLQTVKKFEKDYLRVGYISKMLKDMTIDFNISIIALAQVGRASEGDMPTMAELRGSGDLEQDADNIIFLHRPDDANDKFVHPDDKSLLDTLKTMKKQYIVLSIAKQRQGETAVVPTVFAPGQMTFTEIIRASD